MIDRLCRDSRTVDILKWDIPGVRVMSGFAGNTFDINLFEVGDTLEELEQFHREGQKTLFFPPCHYALLVFDIARGDHFTGQRLKRWVDVIEAEQLLCDVMFVGNKWDLIPHDLELNHPGTLAIGMHIVQYSRQLEREYLDRCPENSQKYACFKISAEQSPQEKFTDILKHIMEWGPTRVADFGKKLSDQGLELALGCSNTSVNVIVELGIVAIASPTEYKMNTYYINNTLIVTVWIE